MLRVGFVGYRGMVGSVLLNRMLEENDFARINPVFFSASNIGAKPPILCPQGQTVLNAHDLNALEKLDCIVTTQGSDYTNLILPKLRDSGWSGYFIDASSALRMNDDTIIALDPVNQHKILDGIKQGIKNFAGGNCSITLSLLGLMGLLKAGLIEWMSIMTYQAASGAGAKNVRELLCQMAVIADNNSLLIDDKTPILDLIKNTNDCIQSSQLPTSEFGVPLAGSVIPWIDLDLNNGNSKEESKGESEANKLLGLLPGTIKIDGLCIRVGTIRSHAAAITMKLNEDLSICQIEDKIKNNNPWVNYVPNNKLDSLKYLTPAATAGSLKIAVGRLKKSNIDANIYNVLTIGDQLLWGAAEPLRRMLNILVEYHK